MILAWLTYCVLVSTLLGLAALAAERALAWQGWPTRWAWVAAIMGSLAMPLGVRLMPAASSTASLPPLPGALVMTSLPAVTSSATRPEGLTAEAVLLALWVAASAGLLTYLLLAAARLWSRSRGWGRREVEGVPVLVSRDTGPAALGLLRGQVVVPEWALELDAPRRRLLVLHEAEHVRARDPQLASAALVGCALMPWNPLLWWQLARLKLAIEVDCDGRVVRRSGDLRAYGSLLLEVGWRRAGLALGLAESRSMLERRIRRITRTTTGRRTLRALGLAVVSGLVLAVACETPSPTELGAPEQRPLTLHQIQRLSSGDACDPVVYVNGERVDRSVVDGMDESEIDHVEIIGSSNIGGEPARPDSAAGDGPCGIRFGQIVATGPAVLILTRDATVEQADRHRRLKEELATARSDRTGATAEDLEQLASQPTFTPMTVRPQLRNREKVRQALADFYPPLLKSAGIGGSTNVWFFIDVEGVVKKVRVNKSSGYDALDAAALKVADVMEFTPAYNRDVRVPVWFALDVTFEVDGPAAADASADPEGYAEVRDVEIEIPPTPEELRQRAAEAQEGDQPPVPGRPVSDQSIQEGPRFTPMTVRPQLTNPGEIQQALMDYYPPLLRDAGIGGTANVWFYIDATGQVRKLLINKPSGYEALDQAALEVGGMMEFTPAYNRDVKVPVWVALDITFEVK